MKKIIPIAILLILLVSGGMALAQDDQPPSTGVLPDSPFHFLKTWKEQIQLFFTFGAENKAKQYLHLADVRMAEYQRMIEKGKTDIAQRTLEKYEKQLNHALQKIEELKNKGRDVTEISQKSEDSIAKHIAVLQRNLQKAPESAKEGLERALDNAEKLIQKKMTERREEKCVASGGKVSASLCCNSVSDFPNLCLIGACGCSSENSYEVKVCDCGEGKCFNGNKCVALEALESAEE